jgi:cytochrome c biogenesis protein CcmG/thiol:disulfide interchange protein DsbE
MTDDSRSILRRWFRRIAPWALAGFVLFLVLRNLGDKTLLRVGAEAPALTAERADGGHFELSEHRGEVVVVNFWATWCPPCREEAPVLARVHERIAEEGGLVIGLSADEAPLGEVAKVARKLGMTYPIAYADPTLRRTYRVQVLPTTYVVAPDGTVARSFVGAVSESELTTAVEQARDPSG